MLVFLGRRVFVGDLVSIDTGLLSNEEVVVIVAPVSWLASVLQAVAG